MVARREGSGRVRWASAPKASSSTWRTARCACQAAECRGHGARRVRRLHARSLAQKPTVRSIIDADDHRWMLSADVVRYSHQAAQDLPVPRGMTEGRSHCVRGEVRWSNSKASMESVAVPFPGHRAAAGLHRSGRSSTRCGMALLEGLQRPESEAGGATFDRSASGNFVRRSSAYRELQDRRCRTRCSCACAPCRSPPFSPC